MQTFKEKYIELLSDVEGYQTQIERLKLVFEASKEGLWDMDKDGQVRFFNSSFYENFDFKVDEGILEDWVDLVHPDDRQLFYDNVEEQIGNSVECFKSQYRVKNAQGDYVWIDAIGLSKFDENGELIFMVGSHMDVTEQKQFQDKIYQMAYFDDVSGLMNRERLNEIVSDDIRNGGEGALIQINIREFQIIHDIYGHVFGDKIINLVAQRIMNAVGLEHRVSIISKDQFVVYISEEFEDAEISTLAFKLLNDLRNTFMVGKRSIELDAYIGIIVFPKYGTDFEELMQNANLTAIYAGEQGNCPCIFFNENIKDLVLKNLRIESNLKTALDMGEFYLTYQPVVCMQTKEVVSFEALLRWNSSEMGMIPPDVFIPVAEKNFLINAIGYYVLEEACCFGKRIRERYSDDYKMAVNISVIQLLQEDFALKVKWILDKTGFAPKDLALEITESMLLESNSKIIGRLNQLRDMGIRIALDDFGTGYSSLNNLLNLPLSHVKIDRSLLWKSMTSVEVTALIQSVISYSHNMQMSIVVEGVEDENMLDKVARLDGNYSQGYYFAKPLEEKDVIAYLDKTYSEEEKILMNIN